MLCPCMHDILSAIFLLYERRLRGIVRARKLNLMGISHSVLSDQLLARVLRTDWRGVKEIKWRPGKDAQPSKSWILKFWSYLEKVICFCIFVLKMSA